MSAYIALSRTQNGGLGLARLLDGFLEGVPAEQGALDAHRVLDDPLQRDKVAELLLVALGLAGHHRLDRLGERGGVLHREPLDLLGHHRGARLRDRAALALERDPLDFSSASTRVSTSSVEL